ncbi:hypothetical protein [Streptomyces sp. NPDC020917]|uniref:hypothetical protein n=1 Tax=Streptomyces sp. NPDC020917 TaxID=3365102 RepID=UPI0037B8BEE4
MKMLGKGERCVVRAGIAVVDQLSRLVTVALAVTLPPAHLHCGQDEFGVLGGGRGPADDAAGEGIDDERDIRSGVKIAIYGWSTKT